MEREAMYRFLQACLSGEMNYETGDGVTFYRGPVTGLRQHTLVLDLLIDRYVVRPGQPIELSVPETADEIGFKTDEVFDSVMTLARITLVSNYIEERLIRVDQAKLDGHGNLTLVIGFNAWLTHHLSELSLVTIEPLAHAHVI